MHDDDFIRTRSGARLFVRDWGRGAPVLLLPGWAMTSDLWATVMLRLNELGLRAISYDRRGHGRSSDPGPMDYDALADDLADVIPGGLNKVAGVTATQTHVAFRAYSRHDLEEAFAIGLPAPE